MLQLNNFLKQSSRKIPFIPCYGQVCCRSLSKRTEYEEEFHLNRNISKYDIDPALQQKWSRQMKVQPWLAKPLKLATSTPYEMDALEDIHRRSFSANVLLEIRDVRLPASTHHPSFTRLAKHRLHLICYTHADLIDAETRDRVELWTAEGWPGSRSIFVDTRENRSDLPYDLLYDSLLRHLEEAGGINTALTVGVPNTGKSSVLMALIRLARKRGEIGKKLQATTVSRKSSKRKLTKASPIAIADKPGKTREITEYLIREKPRAFFLDVPGMTPPRFYFEERPESWFAFGAGNLLCQDKTMEDDIEIQMAFCDYTLYALNRDKNFGYVKKLNLEKPTENIDEVLCAIKRGTERDHKNPEKLQLRRCHNFLKFLNTGNLGSVILDDISKPYRKFVFKDEHFIRKKGEKPWVKKGEPIEYDSDVGEDEEFFDDDFAYRENRNEKKGPAGTKRRSSQFRG